MFYGAAEILLLGEAARHGSIGPVGKGILSIFFIFVLIETVIQGARYTFNFIKKIKEEKTHE